MIKFKTKQNANETEMRAQEEAYKKENYDPNASVTCTVCGAREGTKHHYDCVRMKTVDELLDAGQNLDVDPLVRAKEEAEHLLNGAMTGAMWPRVNLPSLALPTPEPRWLSLAEAAKHVHMGTTKFAKLRSGEDGPRFYRLKDGSCLYNVHDLNAWVMRHPNV